MPSLRESITTAKNDTCRVPCWLLVTAWNQRIRGWGEASLQGQSTPAWRSFRPARACVRAVLLMSNQRWNEGLAASPFSFRPRGHFPFPFRVYHCSLRWSEPVCVDLLEFESGLIWMCGSAWIWILESSVNLNESEWDCPNLAEFEWLCIDICASGWVWRGKKGSGLKLCESEWVRARLKESESIRTRLSESEWDWVKFCEYERIWLKLDEEEQICARL